MTIKEAIVFAYGFIFGASTQYLKPKQRFLFSTLMTHFDDQLTFCSGGSGICARFGTDLLINTNTGEAADHWRGEIEKLGGLARATVVLSSLNGAFGSIETLRRLPTVRTVFIHADHDVASFEKIGEPASLENLQTKKTLRIHDEIVHLIPVNGGPTESDLVVFFERRSVMMFGALFANRIHPELSHGVSARVPAWIDTLESLLREYQPRVAVPSEGGIGTSEDVREFIRYLTALTDPHVEFSTCRANFDWMEIPSATSLEENFDVLRRNVKTHTSLTLRR